MTSDWLLWYTTMDVWKGAHLYATSRNAFFRYSCNGAITVETRLYGYWGSQLWFGSEHALGKPSKSFLEENHRRSRDWSYKDTSKQGSLCASDINVHTNLSWWRYIHMQTIHKQYSLVIDNSDIKYEHVVQLTQALIYTSAPTHSWHTDKHTQFCADAPNLQSKHTLRYINK